MGTTATSLHVLSAVVLPGSRLPVDIEKAYRKLGYARPKQAGEGATKRVILAPDASGDWLSIYDSQNDRTDTGELKQLAVEITRKLGTVALLTSVYDSDSFEFVMFHMGRQVDAAVSEPESHTGGLRMLKGTRRAWAWYSMFIGRDLPRAVQAGRQGKLLEGWEERLKVSPGSTTPFAARRGIRRRPHELSGIAPVIHPHRVPPPIWPIIRVRDHIAPIRVRDHIAPGEATCGLGGDGLARGNGRDGLANGSETFRSSD